MKIVSPDDITTLITNKYEMGIAFCTARAALRHLMNGRFKGVDASGIAYTWDGTDNSVNELPANPLNWSSRNLQFHDDQPVLRSSANLLGDTIEWPIPTTVICTHFFGFRVQKNEKVNLRKLFKHYKGVCQLCLRKGLMADMTIDHVYPKALGGSNHDFNLVLAHRSCNNAKGAQTPYFNAAGKEVKGKSMLRTGVLIPDVDLRDEWKPYMMLE